MKRHDLQIPEWITSPAPVVYDDAIAFMNKRVQEIQQGKAPELIWLLTHPPLLTLGTSADSKDIHTSSLPQYQTGRGGQVTYHDPGQRIVYALLDLKARKMDLKAYIWSLEEWILMSLKTLGIEAERRQGRVGLWIAKTETYDEKIAALGVRVQKWVTSHGAAINVAPNLEAYKTFTPCGITDHGVTSFQALRLPASFTELDQALQSCFDQVF